MNRAFWIICVSAVASLTGCYSLDQYSGEGSIARGTANLTRYEILLPPLDMTSDREQIFTVSGTPRQHFMIMLRVTGDAATLLDGKTFVHATLVDSGGNVLDERDGFLGRRWRPASSNEPQEWIDLISPSRATSRSPRLTPGSKYTVKIIVRPAAARTNCIVSPVLWAGGAVPWE